MHQLFLYGWTVHTVCCGKNLKAGKVHGRLQQGFPLLLRKLLKNPVHIVYQREVWKGNPFFRSFWYLTIRVCMAFWKNYYHRSDETARKKYAILHISDSRYCFAVGEKELVLRLRMSKEDDGAKVYLIYAQKYDFTLKRQKKGWKCVTGIDGWRLDVSDEVSHDFWRRFRKEVKKSIRAVSLLEKTGMMHILICREISTTVL